jgi:hypothetical protein
VTVPYATNDAVSPEAGGTDSAIEADGVYTVNVEDGGITTVAVDESTVLDGGTVDVEFSGNSSSTDATDPSDDDSDTASSVVTPTDAFDGQRLARAT